MWNKFFLLCAIFSIGGSALATNLVANDETILQKKLGRYQTELPTCEKSQGADWGCYFTIQTNFSENGLKYFYINNSIVHNPQDRSKIISPAGHSTTYVPAHYQGNKYEPWMWASRSYWENLVLQFEGYGRDYDKTLTVVLIASQNEHHAFGNFNLYYALTNSNNLPTPASQSWTILNQNVCPKKYTLPSWWTGANINMDPSKHGFNYLTFSYVNCLEGSETFGVPNW